MSSSVQRFDHKWNSFTMRWLWSLDRNMALLPSQLHVLIFLQYFSHNSWNKARFDSPLPHKERRRPGGAFEVKKRRIQSILKAVTTQTNWNKTLKIKVNKSLSAVLHVFYLMSVARISVKATISSARSRREKNAEKLTVILKGKTAGKTHLGSC